MGIWKTRRLDEDSLEAEQGLWAIELRFYTCIYLEEADCNVSVRIAPPSGSRLPNSPWANRALGACRKEAGTDRSSFEANKSLTCQKAASSTNRQRVCSLSGLRAP